MWVVGWVRLAWVVVSVIRGRVLRLLRGVSRLVCRGRSGSRMTFTLRVLGVRVTVVAWFIRLRNRMIVTVPLGLVFVRLTRVACLGVGVRLLRIVRMCRVNGWVSCVVWRRGRIRRWRILLLGLKLISLTLRRMMLMCGLRVGRVGVWTRRRWIRWFWCLGIRVWIIRGLLCRLRWWCSLCLTRLSWVVCLRLRRPWVGLSEGRRLCRSRILLRLLMQSFLLVDLTYWKNLRR